MTWPLNTTNFEIHAFPVKFVLNTQYSHLGVAVLDTCHVFLDVYASNDNNLKSNESNLSSNSILFKDRILTTKDP